MSLGSIVLQAISVFFSVFVSKKIGPEAMGLFTLTKGIYGFGITVATSGINLAVVRLVSGALPYNKQDTPLDSKGPVFKIMKNAAVYSLSFSSLATVLLLSLAVPIGKYLINDLRVVPSIKIMAFSLIPIAVSSLINGYFCAVRRSYKNVIVQFLEQGFKISLVTLFLTLIAPSGIEYACLSLALGGLLSEILSVFVNMALYFIDKRRYFSSKSDGGEKSDFSVFSAAFPVAVSAYVRSALSAIEHLLIPWGLKKSGVGATAALSSYGILHGMVFPLIFFPSSLLGAFSSLLVPEIASSYEAKDFSRIKRIVTYVFSFSLLFSLGVSGVFISFSSEIGLYFFGSREAGEFVRLIAPLVPLMYLDFAVDALLKGLGEQIYSMRVNIIDSLISVILIFVLVPTLGINGYIAIIFITELTNTSLSIIRLLNKTEVKPKIVKWIFKPTACIITSTLLCRLIFTFINLAIPSFLGGKASTVIQMIVCILFYIFFSSITGAISNEDLSLFKVKGESKI